MSGQYAVFVEGLSDLDLEQMSPQIERNAVMAINKTADYARARTKEDLKRIYNFPGSYLDPASGRLIVSRRANSHSLEATLSARARATSLTRFMVSNSGVGKAGVAVEILRGQRKEVKGGFTIRLNGNNLGLAVRTKNNVKPKGSYKPVQLRNGLWLLYGPSVNQAFNYSRELTADQSAVFLAQEFSRLQETFGL